MSKDVHGNNKVSKGKPQIVLGKAKVAEAMSKDFHRKT
jgi:hypothetical protein